MKRITQVSLVYDRLSLLYLYQKDLACSEVTCFIAYYIRSELLLVSGLILERLPCSDVHARFHLDEPNWDDVTGASKTDLAIDADYIKMFLV